MNIVKANILSLKHFVLEINYNFIPLWFLIALYEAEFLFQDSLSKILQFKNLKMSMTIGIPDAKFMDAKISDKRGYDMPENLTYDGDPHQDQSQ